MKLLASEGVSAMHLDESLKSMSKHHYSFQQTLAVQPPLVPAASVCLAPCNHPSSKSCSPQRSLQPASAFPTPMERPTSLIQIRLVIPNAAAIGFTTVAPFQSQSMDSLSLRTTMAP